MLMAYGPVLQEGSGWQGVKSQETRCSQPSLKLLGALQAWLGRVLESSFSFGTQYPC